MNINQNLNQTRNKILESSFLLANKQSNLLIFNLSKYKN